MFIRLGILSCICLALSATAPAQYLKPGVEGPIPFASLSEMESQLDLASAAQRAEWLTRLGVDAAVAARAAQSLLPGQRIRVEPVRVPGREPHGVAFVPSGTSGSCFVILLAGSADSAHPAWHKTDSHQLDCWHSEAVLEIVPLRHAGADDLLIHHVNESHGSNSIEDQTQVFSIFHGKLVQTLATQDYLSEEVLGEETTREQVSTFVRFPGNVLEETRTSAENEKLRAVERRYWRWSHSAQKFLPTPFVRVDPPRAAQ